MDSKDFFEANREKIHATAEFLCGKDLSKNVDKKFEELKQQYFNCEDTGHNEVIKINDSELDIRTWLDIIRHKENEHFVFIAVINKQLQIIFDKAGDQFSCPEINLDDIDAKIIDFITRRGAISVGIYIMHNHPYHPFIYRASPSKSDLHTCEAILKELANIETAVKSIGINCQISFIDFAIVTEYDYWSVKQAIEESSDINY